MLANLFFNVIIQPEIVFVSFKTGNLSHNSLQPHSSHNSFNDSQSMYSNNSNHRERYRYSNNNNNNNNGVGTSSGSNNNSPHSNTSQYTNGIRKSDSPSRKRRRISRLPNQTPPVVVWDQRRPQRHQPQVKNIFFLMILEARKFLREFLIVLF